MRILKFHVDPARPGVPIPDDEATRAAFEAIDSARSAHRPAEGRESVNIRESKTLGPGWVKVPIPTETEQSVVRSFILLGLSESEARFAATGRVDITDDYHSVTALQALLGRR
jgi:hypothetical protein